MMGAYVEFNLEARSLRVNQICRLSTDEAIWPGRIARQTGAPDTPQEHGGDSILVKMDYHLTGTSLDVASPRTHVARLTPKGGHMIQPRTTRAVHLSTIAFSCAPFSCFCFVSQIIAPWFSYNDRTFAPQHTAVQSTLDATEWP